MLVTEFYCCHDLRNKTVRSTVPSQTHVLICPESYIPMEKLLEIADWHYEGPQWFGLCRLMLMASKFSAWSLKMRKPGWLFQCWTKSHWITVFVFVLKGDLACRIAHKTWSLSSPFPCDNFWFGQKQRRLLLGTEPQERTTQEGIQQAQIQIHPTDRHETDQRNEVFT